MGSWQRHCNVDPVTPLLASDSAAVSYFARRDLLGEPVLPVASLWQLPGVTRLVRRQRSGGRWSYPGGGAARIRSAEDYDQLETFRALGELVEKYGLTREHPAIVRAAEFLFAHQTTEGDLRGILGTQYSPYYTAAILELLCKAGYENDARLDRGIRWLLAMRQADGGWALPLRTVGGKYDRETLAGPLLQPDRRRPSSHLVTGMVLRAVAVHSHYRATPVVRTAAEFLTTRLFAADRYPDRRAPRYWLVFSYPFWFTDLISALDSLSLVGFRPVYPAIRRALEWLVSHQGNDGLWHLTMVRGTNEPARDEWLSLAICRILKRMYSEGH
jgi:Squalene-hopene cyclase C-terminal domain